MTSTGVVALVTALAAGLAAGCGTGPGPATTAAATASPELSATSVYGRHAAVRERVDVRLANDGDGPVEVVALQVRHPLFAQVPPLDRTSTLPPDGRARIVPVPFGAPDCAATGGAAPVVAVVVRTPDGEREVEVPLVDGEPGLARAHRAACAVEAVRAVVQLDLAPFGPADGGSTALTLRRRGAGEVAVTGVGGNVLFSVDAPAASPLTVLPDGRDGVAVPLVVRASRCDPHALTESKTSFVLPVFVALDGGEPVLVPTEVSAPARGALQALLDTTCAPGG